MNIEVELSGKIDRIMTHSEWICNACGEGFETKGRRDGHRERMHRQRMPTEVEKQGLERSEKGKFTCKCGKEYMIAQSLKRHQRSCKIEVFTEERRNPENDDDKGTFSYLR